MRQTTIMITEEEPWPLYVLGLLNLKFGDSISVVEVLDGSTILRKKTRTFKELSGFINASIKSEFPPND